MRKKIRSTKFYFPHYENMHRLATNLYEIECVFENRKILVGSFDLEALTLKLNLTLSRNLITPAAGSYAFKSKANAIRCVGRKLKARISLQVASILFVILTVIMTYFLSQVLGNIPDSLRHH